MFPVEDQPIFEIEDYNDLKAGQVISISFKDDEGNRVDRVNNKMLLTKIDGDKFKFKDLRGGIIEVTTNLLPSGKRVAYIIN